ncbi:MAG: ferrochelatase [Terracidiphilus sp.]
MGKHAVLLLAHGTPETVEQIPVYLRNVTSGRPLPQAVVEEIQHRYALIGRSPLTAITMEQARLLEAELVASELAAWGEPPRVYVGMRNWRPYIADVVRQMRADGVEAAAVICLAPQNSRTSVGLYRRAVEAEAGVPADRSSSGWSEAAGLRIDFTQSWADHPLLAEAFAERLRAAEERLKAETGAAVPVLFTAHSVPLRTVDPAAGLDAGPRLWPGQGADPYAEDARKTAAMVAARVPEIPRWWFAFQSQGASGGPWLGPTVEETLDSIAASTVKALILQPIGFLCDHVEILYDVDHHFREFATRLGVRLERPESLNASATLARALADLARRGIERLRR